MGGLFQQYEASKAGCGASIYQRAVSCSASNLKNWGGTAESGYIWQSLTKSCPSFATEWAAVLLRYSGGNEGEWGPLRTKAAEVTTQCFALYTSVDAYIAAHPDICTLVYQ